MKKIIKKAKTHNAHQAIILCKRIYNHAWLLIFFRESKAKWNE